MYLSFQLANVTMSIFPEKTNSFLPPEKKWSHPKEMIEKSSRYLRLDKFQEEYVVFVDVVTRVIDVSKFGPFGPRKLDQDPSL